MIPQPEIFFEGNGRSTRIRAVASIHTKTGTVYRVEGGWESSSGAATEGLVQELAKRYQVELIRHEVQEVEINDLRGKVEQATQQRLRTSDDHLRLAMTIGNIEQAATSIVGFLEDLKD